MTESTFTRERPKFDHNSARELNKVWALIFTSAVGKHNSNSIFFFFNSFLNNFFVKNNLCGSLCKSGRVQASTGRA